MKVYILCTIQNNMNPYSDHPNLNAYVCYLQFTPTRSSPCGQPFHFIVVPATDRQAALHRYTQLESVRVLRYQAHGYLNIPYVVSLEIMLNPEYNEGRTGP
jgi:hypothetical protein